MNEKTAGFLSSFLIHIFFILLMFLLVYQPKTDFFRIEIIEFGYNADANNESFISPPAVSPVSSGIPDRGSFSNIIPDI